jgi:hypothetical protein
MANGDFGMPVIDDAVFKIKIKILQICRIKESIEWSYLPTYSEDYKYAKIIFLWWGKVISSEQYASQ